MATKAKNTTAADLLAAAAKPIAEQMTALSAQISHNREQLDQAIAELQTKFESDSAELIGSYTELFEALEKVAPREAEQFEDPDVLAGRPKPARATASRNGRKSRGAFDEAAVLAFIRSSSEPVGAGDIKEHAGDVSGATLSNSLKRLVDEGKLTKTGEKRGTKYQAS